MPDYLRAFLGWDPLGLEVTVAAGKPTNGRSTG